MDQLYGLALQEARSAERRSGAGLARAVGLAVVALVAALVDAAASGRAA